MSGKRPLDGLLTQVRGIKIAVKLFTVVVCFVLYDESDRKRFLIASPKAPQFRYLASVQRRGILGLLSSAASVNSRGTNGYEAR